jgi:hypothetical protein
MTHRRTYLFRLAALGLLLPLVACGDPEPDVEPMDTPPPEEALQEPAPTGEMVHHTITLSEMNDSGVTGEAMAMHSDDAVVLILEMEGLPGEGEYAAHIHHGNCEDGGPVAVPLDPVIGLADGTGSSTTTLELDEMDEDEPHFIMVHGDGGNPVACGDMEGHGH